MAVKKFFKKVGRNIQRTGGALTTGAGKSFGGVLGAAAGQRLLAGLTAAAPVAEEAAPLLLLKTGGFIPGARHKPTFAILHGQETVIPANAKVTKHQKKVIASNKRNAKKECGCHKFVYE
jgi:hypothetical protein